MVESLKWKPCDPTVEISKAKFDILPRPVFNLNKRENNDI